MQPSATWPSSTTVPTLPSPGSSLPHVIKQEKREPGGNWAPSVGFGSLALPPNADTTDRRTDRGREQVPVGFCLSRKEAKLNWLKNDGTAAAGASSPLLKTHFQSDLIKTAGGPTRSGRGRASIGTQPVHAGKRRPPCHGAWRAPRSPRCRVNLWRIAAETPCACRQCDGGVTANEKQCRRRRFAESPSQAGHAKILRAEARKAMKYEGGRE